MYRTGKENTPKQQHNRPPAASLLDSLNSGENSALLWTPVRKLAIGSSESLLQSPVSRAVQSPSCSTAMDLSDALDMSFLDDPLVHDLKETVANNKPSLTLAFSPVLPHAEPDAVVQYGAYGLDGFDDVFITANQLECAREKLGEEEAKTVEQVMQESVLLLRRFHCQDVLDTNDSLMTFSAVGLGHQHHLLGQGELNVDPTAVRWLGALGQEGSACNLVWTRRQLGDIRLKCLNDGNPPILQVTIDDVIFLQFAFPDLESATACLDMLCQKKECDTTDGDEYQMALSRLQSELEEAKRRRDEAIALAEQVFSQESIRINAAIEAHAVLKSSTAAAAPDAHRNDDETAADCQICFGEKVDKVLKPCMHSMCSSCLLQLQTMGQLAVCPWDRIPIASVDTLFQ